MYRLAERILLSAVSACGIRDIKSEPGTLYRGTLIAHSFTLSANSPELKIAI